MTPSLPGKEAVYLCDGVVAEQRGAMLEAVAVSWFAADGTPPRRGDLVGCEDVLARAARGLARMHCSRPSVCTPCVIEVLQENLLWSAASDP